MARSIGQLDRESVIEAETDLGPIWLQKDAEQFTPAVLEHGYWGPEINGLMRTALRPGMTFVDAGANIGYFSVLASQLVGPEGRVFAVEPDPQNIRILEANLSRQQWANWTVLPVAAWSERTHLNLTVSPASGGAVSSVGGVDASGGLIEAAPLDELVQGQVDYLKVDCESTDHVVVTGARRLIRDNPKMLITVEFAPGVRTHTGHTSEQILETYEQMGLSPYNIHPQGSGVTATSYEALLARESPDEVVLFDFALSARMPKRLINQKGLLEKAGDLLEFVPERIRPPIRDRDRKPRD